jgi:hypothetical protein
MNILHGPWSVINASLSEPKQWPVHRDEVDWGMEPVHMDLDLLCALHYPSI